MNYQLTITGDSAEELLDVMQTLKEGRGTTVVSRPVKKNEPAKPERSAAEFTEESADGTEGDKITVEALREAVKQKIDGDSKTKEKVKGLLKKHGADSVTALDASKYSEFLKDLKAL